MSLLYLCCSVEDQVELENERLLPSSQRSSLEICTLFCLVHIKKKLIVNLLCVLI